MFGASMLQIAFLDVAFLVSRCCNVRDVTLFCFSMLQTIFSDVLCILFSCCDETTDVAILHTMNDVACNIVVCCDGR